MKKQIFTLLFMLALVAVTGNVFAQTGSTPTAPYEGAIHTYVLGGLTAGDRIIATGVDTDLSSYNDEDTGNDYFSITARTSGQLLGTTASITVQWAATAGETGNYFVWFQIQDGSGCSTYRALQVTPVNAPTAAYDVNYTVLAITAGDGTTTTSDITTPEGSNNETDCPGFEGATRLATEINGVMNDGNSYVYYKIVRTSAAIPNTTWDITPSVTAGTAANWAYSTDAAATFNNFTIANPITGIATNVIYLRGVVTNSTSSQTITVAIANGDDTVYSTDTNKTHTSPANLTINSLPTVGNFSGSN